MHPYLLQNLVMILQIMLTALASHIFEHQEVFLYLTAVLDWYSRFILSWELSVTMDREIPRFSIPTQVGCLPAKNLPAHLAITVSGFA